MAHTRTRYLIGKLKKTMSWSPAISVIGMRQSGKTTLLKSLTDSYFTLDDDKILFDFEKGDWSRLENARPPITIDECQKLGKVFDRVKLMVDRNRKPGLFLLTGSVRFLSKKNIRESLTGRTAILELLPLLHGEAHERPQRQDILDVFKFDPTTQAKKIESHFEAILSKNWTTSSQIQIHIGCGGLPGICFKREPAIRKQMMGYHLDTLLGRDLPALYATKLSFERLNLIYRDICLHQGTPIKHSEIARRTRVTPPTVAALIDKFEALFLLRKIGQTIYAEDSALSRYALGGDLLNVEVELQAFVFREMLGLLHYGVTDMVRLSEYRTRGGTHVPVVLEFGDGRKLGLCIDAQEGASEKSIRGLESFLKSNKNRNARGIIFTLGKKVNLLRAGILVLPIETVC